MPTRLRRSQAAPNIVGGAARADAIRPVAPVCHGCRETPAVSAWLKPVRAWARRGRCRPDRWLQLGPMETLGDVGLSTVWDVHGASDAVLKLARDARGGGILQKTRRVAPTASLLWSSALLPSSDSFLSTEMEYRPLSSTSTSSSMDAREFGGDHVAITRVLDVHLKAKGHRRWLPAERRSHQTRRTASWKGPCVPACTESCFAGDVSTFETSGRPLFAAPWCSLVCVQEIRFISNAREKIFSVC